MAPELDLREREGAGAVGSRLARCLDSDPEVKAEAAVEVTGSEPRRRRATSGMWGGGWSCENCSMIWGLLAFAEVEPGIEVLLSEDEDERSSKRELLRDDCAKLPATGTELAGALIGCCW